MWRVVAHRGRRDWDPRDLPIDRTPPSLPMLSMLLLLPMLRIDMKLPMLRMMPRSPQTACSRHSAGSRSFCSSMNGFIVFEMQELVQRSRSAELPICAYCLAYGSRA